MARSAKTDTDKASTPKGAVDSGPLPAPEFVAGQTAADVVAEDSTPSTDVAAGLADSVLIVDPDAIAEPEPAAFVPPPPSIEAKPTKQEPIPPAKARRSGFVPLVLGGVVAATLGFLAAWQLLTMNADSAAEVMAAQAERIAGLEAQIAALPEPAPVPDLSPLTGDIAGLRADIGPLAERLTGLEDRIAGLERAPAADGTLSGTAIASWEAELDTLKADIAVQEERMLALADAAAERLDAAQSTVGEIEQNATASATSVLQRATISRIQAAVDSGTPFDAALGDLTSTGVAVPDVLTAAAAEGVPTIAALADTFPEAARAALATARAEGLADDGDGRVMSFLRSQFDVRSVAPREGDDPDAILSRAEAALHDGRLSDALAEVGALPEVVRADMTGWITQAEGRVAVIAALQLLSETLPATSN